MLARNSLCARLAASAASLATRKVSSFSRASVTSWKAPTMREYRPSMICGSPMDRTQRWRPRAVMKGDDEIERLAALERGGYGAHGHDPRASGG